MLQPIRYHFTHLLLITTALVVPHTAPAGKFEFEVIADKKDGLKNPFGVGFDAEENFYIVEYLGGHLYKMAPGGRPEVIAGNGTDGYAGDGGPAKEAIFNGMHNVCVTPEGVLYISDTRGNRIRMIDTDGKVSTIAGNGESGFSGDGGPASEAKLADPISIALSRDHKTLLIADIHNRRIRAVDLEKGIISTVAGNGKRGIPEDGAIATRAPLADPRGCEIDSKGNLYVLERGGHALRVVTPDGRVKTVSGSGKKGSKDGIGREAEMNGPKHICIDDQDRVIVADAENHLIRRFDPESGRLETIVGKEEGDPKLNRPHGVWWHDGVLYIADSWNDRVLKATPKD